MTPRGWGAAGVWTLVLLSCVSMLVMVCLGFAWLAEHT
jgi:hypothetical protein